MFLPVAFVFALSGLPLQQTAPMVNLIDPAIVEPKRKSAPVIPSDFNIVKQLDALYAAEPNRVVCLSRSQPGKLLPRRDCATLSQWYRMNRDRDLPAKLRVIYPKDSGPPDSTAGPPYELIDMVKARYDSPKVRAAALARAQQRLKAEPNAKTR